MSEEHARTLTDALELAKRKYYSAKCNSSDYVKAYYAIMDERRDRRVTCNCTGSRVMSWVTIGDVTILSYYDRVVASIYKTDGNMAVVRHTNWRGDCGLTAAINNCIFGTCRNSGVRVGTYMTSQRWDQLPVIPFEQYVPRKTNMEPYRVRKTVKMWRTALTHAIVMTCEDEERQKGLHLLRQLDEMVQDNAKNTRVWYSEYLIEQIVTFISKAYEGVDVPEYYDEL